MTQYKKLLTSKEQHLQHGAKSNKLLIDLFGQQIKKKKT